MAGRKQLKYSAKSESSKVRKIIDVFELENPELKDLPLKYRKLYDKARRADIAAGIQPVDYQWKGDPWTSWSGGKNKSPKFINRVHYNLQQKIKKARNSGKFIKLEEYQNHPSLKDDPELAKQLFEYNNKEIERISNKSTKSLHDDHISPKSKPEYGWEVARNKQLLASKDNIVKGNLSPSDQLMNRLGIGKTKAEQIDLLRSSPIDPDTGGKYTPRKVRQLVAEDLGLKFTKGINKTNKYNFATKLATETAADNYDFEEVNFTANGNGVNGNGNGNGVNGKNGNGVNGRNGKFKKAKGGRLRKIDQGLNLALQLKTGDYTGAAVSGSTITAAELLKTKTGQKAIARQISKIAAKQGGKQALKLIPGFDVYISGREAWDYLRRGRFDQAGISALSGAIGWIPGGGDLVSAALDLTNTGISLKRGDYDLLTDEDVDTKKTKGKVRSKVTRRTKL